MIVVHYLNNSRSQRVLWLLEELGIEYDVKYYERDEKTMLAPASLRQVHPLGKSPVITDSDLTLAETGAIIEYIVGRYGNGQLVPAPGTKERLRYTYWLHYAEGSAMPPLVMKIVFDHFGTGDSGASSAFIEPQIKLQMSFPLEVVAMIKEQVDNRPKLKEFVERIHERPAYKRAIERGGKYENFFGTDQSP